ncbi:ParB/RepB/Spo0J family partition protein [Vulgatibacter sp.]|uniref:ParB/RepB/Spo0J family partition protein n=1 Tax=Vulgatibacter sp. TaxID=1971226 RepID=UPI003564CDE6
MARPTPPPRELTYVPLARIGEDTTFRLRQAGDISSLARSIAQAGQLFPIEVRPAGDGFQAITGFRRLAALKLLFRDRVLVRVHENLPDEAAALVAAADALDNRPLEREELLEMRERYRLMGWSTPALEELIPRAIERAEERLEDLAAQLQGLPPPDRSIVDEDELDEEGPASQAPAVPAAAPQPATEDAAKAEQQEEAPLVTSDFEGVPRPGQRQVAGVAAEPPAEPPGAMPLGTPAPAPPPAERVLTAAELAEDLARRLSILSQDLATLTQAWDDVPPHLRRIVADQIEYYRALGTWLEPAPGDTK